MAGCKDGVSRPVSIHLMCFQQQVGHLLIQPDQLEFVTEIGMGPLTLVEKGRIRVTNLSELTCSYLTCAVKSFRPSVIGSAEDQVALVLEARALATIDHPHVVHFYGLGCYRSDSRQNIRSSLYYVEEFAGSWSLTKMLSFKLKIAYSINAQFTRADALRWCSEAAAGLAHMHECGVVHGWVSCDNIFICLQDGLAYRVAKVANLKPHKHVSCMRAIKRTIDSQPGRQLQHTASSLFTYNQQLDEQAAQQQQSEESALVCERPSLSYRLSRPADQHRKSSQEEQGAGAHVDAATAQGLPPLRFPSLPLDSAWCREQQAGDAAQQLMQLKSSFLGGGGEEQHVVTAPSEVHLLAPALVRSCLKGSASKLMMSGGDASVRPWSRPSGRLPGTPPGSLPLPSASAALGARLPGGGSGVAAGEAGHAEGHPDRLYSVRDGGADELLTKAPSLFLEDSLRNAVAYAEFSALQYRGAHVVDDSAADSETDGCWYAGPPGLSRSSIGTITAPSSRQVRQQRLVSAAAAGAPCHTQPGLGRHPPDAVSMKPLHERKNKASRVHFDLSMASASHLSEQGPWLLYAAPEVFKGHVASCASDVFSLGVVVLELLRRELVTVEADTAEQLPHARTAYAHRVAQGFRESPPTHWAPELQALLAACWHADPAARPSMAHVASSLAALAADRRAIAALEQPPPACVCTIS